MKQKRSNKALHLRAAPCVAPPAWARKIARADGTPIYTWRDGKVLAEKP